MVGVLPAASVYAHVHCDMSVVRLALVHLRGGVLLTGKLSGAAQWTRLWGIHVHNSHMWLCNAVSYLRSKSTPAHRLSYTATRCQAACQRRNAPLFNVIWCFFFVFFFGALQSRPCSRPYGALTHLCTSWLTDPVKVTSEVSGTTLPPTVPGHACGSPAVDLRLAGVPGWMDGWWLIILITILQ